MLESFQERGFVLLVVLSCTTAGSSTVSERWFANTQVAYMSGSFDQPHCPSTPTEHRKVGIDGTTYAVNAFWRSLWCTSPLDLPKLRERKF